MHFQRVLVVFAMIISAGIVSGVMSAPPGLWVYTDEYGSPGYSGVELVDTSCFGPPYEIGIGLSGTPKIGDDAYDYTESIMHYFKFNYQFTQGWSGFKLMWEDRDWEWPAQGYDSLVIKYVGLLTTHKVDIYFGEALSRYDTAFVESIGSLPSNYSNPYSSDAWKTVSLPLPPEPTTAPFSAPRSHLREVRFLIHNVAGVTSMTSDVSYFALDKVGLIKASTGVSARSIPHSPAYGRSWFVPAISGNALLSIHSLSGKRLIEKSLPVVAGQRYNVRRFSRDNAGLSPSQCYVVRITGAGINVQERIWSE